MVDYRSSRALSGRRRRRYRLRGAPEERATSKLRAGLGAIPAAETGSARTILFPRDPADLRGRRFLMVSAPFGPFGVALAEALEAKGAEVRRMIFSAGDAFDWRRPGGIPFRASAEAWRVQAPSLLKDYTDIVIFGEGGAYNRAVLDLGDVLPARIWVLENGYFRPDWITVERNGVNGSSRLPRSREGYLAGPTEASPARSVGRILPHHVANISLHHLAQMVGAPMFPRHANHYTVSPWRQCLGHVRRYLALTFSGSAEGAVDLLIQRGPFFIACLQREGDAQLLRYSRYADNTAFLAEVMRSSSAALSALGFQTPVKVMGDAFFDFAGLTHQGVLDGFWTSPEGPDMDLFARFRAHVIDRTQVNGNYHEPNALKSTAAGVVAVFQRG